MLAYCGVDYEEKLYGSGHGPQFDNSDWLAAKDNLGLEYPNLPYMIDGETKFTETMAILKYVARKWRPALCGINAAEMAKIEMLSHHVNTLKMNVTIACYSVGDREAIIKDSRAPLA